MNITFMLYAIRRVILILVWSNFKLKRIVRRLFVKTFNLDPELTERQLPKILKEQ